MTPPDSDAHEVRRCEICLREMFPNGKAGYQFGLCFRRTLDDRECYRIGYERLALLVGIEPSLAQRILAALEDATWHDVGARTILAELRAHLPKEPK